MGKRTTVAGFHYEGGRELYVEDIPLRQLGEEHGTPLYVYSLAELRSNLDEFTKAFIDSQPLVCYAVKANSNLAVLRRLAALGTGFDVVSGGELQRVLSAGGAPNKIVFSGPGKTKKELHLACEKGILFTSLESPKELELLEEVAASLGREARIAVRLNPNIRAGGHRYIRTGYRRSKFGVDKDTALEMYRRAVELPHITPLGIACHIGSQINKPGPFLKALKRMLSLHDQLRNEGVNLKYIDLGGGYGVSYSAREKALDLENLGKKVQAQLQGKGLKLILEPGRRVAASTGRLLTRVLYRKPNGKGHYLVCDAGMNDLVRPALYQAHHEILPVTYSDKDGGLRKTDTVVGPICESGDVLGKGSLPQVEPGGLLAVNMTGAYSFSMSSQYNTRSRAAEIMVDGDQVYLVRRREKFKDLVHCEQPPLEGINRRPPRDEQPPSEDAA